MAAAQAAATCASESGRLHCTVCNATQALADCTRLIAHYEAVLLAYDSSSGSSSSAGVSSSGNDAQPPPPGAGAAASTAAAAEAKLAALSLGTTLTFAAADAGVVSARCRGIVAEIEVALVFREHCGNFDGWHHGRGGIRRPRWHRGECLMNGYAPLPTAVVMAGSPNAPTRQEIDLAWFPPTPAVPASSPPPPSSLAATATATAAAASPSSSTSSTATTTTNATPPAPSRNDAGAPCPSSTGQQQQQQPRAESNLHSPSSRSSSSSLPPSSSSSSSSSLPLPPPPPPPPPPSLSLAPPVFCEVKEGSFPTAYIVDSDGARSFDGRFESLLVQLERCVCAAAGDQSISAACVGGWVRPLF